MGALILPLIWVLLVAISVHSAKRRGRDPWAWGIACALFWIIFYPALLIAGETDEHRRQMIREEEEVRREVQLSEHNDRSY